MRRSMTVLLLWCAAFAPGPAATRVPDAAAREFERVTADDLRRYVEMLASDALEGRGIGSDGNRAAAAFICDTLKQNGVTPAGADGTCFQPVPIYRPALGAGARLTVSAQDGTALVDLRAGKDFYPLPETGSDGVTAPLVFVNHGITASPLKHDDYARLDARGAIVLALEGAPAGLGGTAEATNRDANGALASVERKVSDAVAHGARGVIVIHDYLPDLQSAWPDRPSVRDATYRLVSVLRARSVPVAAISSRTAAPLREALAKRQTLRAALTPDLAGTPMTIDNVLGIVEGRDARRREIVVVGAHLDHDGVDAEGRVYNGADDNASGTAAVLAAAAAFARAAAIGERPARSVLFAFWNGEEKGSLGAEAFVSSPEPNQKIVANLNLDMVGRHEDADPSDWRFAGFPKIEAAASANTLHVLGYSYTPEFAADLRDANRAVGLTLLEAYDAGAQRLLQRSDNWPFLSRGIPALFLTTGLHPDYHTPEDDTARIDFAKLTRVTKLAARAAWIVADGRAPSMKKR
jgi:hypothetical protein